MKASVITENVLSNTYILYPFMHFCFPLLFVSLTWWVVTVYFMTPKSFMEFFLIASKKLNQPLTLIHCQFLKFYHRFITNEDQIGSCTTLYKQACQSPVIPCVPYNWLRWMELWMGVLSHFSDEEVYQWNIGDGVYLYIMAGLTGSPLNMFIYIRAGLTGSPLNMFPPGLCTQTLPASTCWNHQQQLEMKKHFPGFLLCVFVIW